MSMRGRSCRIVFPALVFAIAVSALSIAATAADEEDGKFLGSIEAARGVISGKIQADVEVGLQVARNNAGSKPAKVTADLKLLLENVERAIDLEPGIRAQLRSQIESALKEAVRREFEESEKRAGNEKARAQGLERQLLVEESARNDARLQQLMDRFNSLMSEGRYEQAEANIAEQIRHLAGSSQSIGESAVWNSRNVGNVLKMYALREHRHKNFVDALFMTERAHVPFPDDPPIVYPDAEVWEELSLRRKKWQHMDVAKQGPAETKILAALNDPTTLEFIETPLKDVIDYLKDLHGIEIQIDAKALETSGLGTDVPVTRNLKGISLRSALRLVLKDLDLSYIIKNEVLLITTPEVATETVVTKVYPVGDLVLPIPSGFSAGGMGMMGGMGGMNGMNGMGGGMNGMMGMNGMNNMGMNRGMIGNIGGQPFMNVEDDVRHYSKAPARRAQSESTIEKR